MVTHARVLAAVKIEMNIIASAVYSYFVVFIENLFPILCERAGLPKDTKLLWFEVFSLCYVSCLLYINLFNCCFQKHSATIRQSCITHEREDLHFIAV